MKKNLYTLILAFLVSGYIFCQDTNGTIVHEINTSRWGQGSVTVMQDEAIQNVVAIHHQDTVDVSKLGVIDPYAEFVKVKGFKIQVFSGNNQQKSKQEALAKQAQIRAEYPDLEATVNFQSPFWRLRVGNFLKKEDAETILKEMRKTFPRFGREMYVVSDVVKKAVDNTYNK